MAYLRVIISYRKLLNLRDLKSIGDSLKTQSPTIYKFASFFRKINSAFLQLAVNSIHLVETYEIVDAFSKRF
jgi:hypothetical protein